MLSIKKILNNSRSKKEPEAFYRRLELDRRLDWPKPISTRHVRRLGMMRQVYIYEFKSRRAFEKAMKLAPSTTNVICGVVCAGGGRQ